MESLYFSQSQAIPDDKLQRFDGLPVVVKSAVGHYVGILNYSYKGTTVTRVGKDGCVVEALKDIKKRHCKIYRYRPVQCVCDLIDIWFSKDENIALHTEMKDGYTQVYRGPANRCPIHFYLSPVIRFAGFVAEEFSKSDTINIIIGEE